MKLIHLSLPLSIVLSLMSGCGNEGTTVVTSSSSTSSSTTSLSSSSKIASSQSSTSISSSSQSTVSRELKGRVIDAYIRDAIVCIDINKNLLCDKDEPSSLSDADGYFSFLSDANVTNSYLLAYDGVDTQTALAFKNVYKADVNATTLTPLSTIFRELKEANLSSSEALLEIKEAFGFNAIVDVNNYDAFKAFDENSSKAKNILTAQLQLQLFTNSLSSLLSSTPDNLSSQEASALLYTQIATRIKEKRSFTAKDEISSMLYAVSNTITFPTPSDKTELEALFTSTSNAVESMLLDSSLLFNESNTTLETFNQLNSLVDTGFNSALLIQESEYDIKKEFTNIYFPSSSSQNSEISSSENLSSQAVNSSQGNILPNLGSSSSQSGGVLPNPDDTENSGGILPQF